MGCPADPLEGKRRAQARSEETAGGIRDQSRMAATRHEAWGNAREPDGETPGRHTFSQALGQKHCSVPL
jgi:hypothetical protein